MASEAARNLRKRMTEAEKRLWTQLRQLKTKGTHFRKQTPIGRYVVDFCCHGARLIIEVDGGQHNEAVGKAVDGVRTKWLESQGYRVLRFWNSDVLENVEGVMTNIAQALAAPPTPGPSPRGGGVKNVARP